MSHSAMTKRLTVELGERSYPIYIGSGLLASPGLLEGRVGGRQVMIVTNETVAPLYLAQVKQLFSGYEVDAVVLPDGEAHKNFETLNLIFDALLKARHSRKTTLVALGGGVVGDMCGFAAATYQRGCDFIQIPTTLLSQVDSSVGGKTGINHPLGKNMIGAFHQPKAVLIDTDTLSTLPANEFSAGLAEVIKYGLIRDVAFLSWLETNMALLMSQERDCLVQAIYRSCELKAEVVAADEKENDVRALLNLGHTFGHAIETHTGYGVWLHGEAVGAGMRMAAELSCQLGWIDPSAVERVTSILKAARLPFSPPAGMTADDFRCLMAVDKKNVDGKLRLVLLKSIGDAMVTDEFDMTVFNSFLEAETS